MYLTKWPVSVYEAHISAVKVQLRLNTKVTFVHADADTLSDFITFELLCQHDFTKSETCKRFIVSIDLIMSVQ